MYHPSNESNVFVLRFHRCLTWPVVLVLAVRNDRKKKTADSAESKDAAVNNNNTKQTDSGNLVTDKDKELIAKILDAHRSTLPGGPLRLHRVSSVVVVELRILVMPLSIASGQLGDKLVPESHKYLGRVIHSFGCLQLFAGFLDLVPPAR